MATPLFIRTHKNDVLVQVKTNIVSLVIGSLFIDALLLISFLKLPPVPFEIIPLCSVIIAARILTPSFIYSKLSNPRSGKAVVMIIAVLGIFLVAVRRSPTLGSLVVALLVPLGLLAVHSLSDTVPKDSPVSRTEEVRFQLLIRFLPLAAARVIPLTLAIAWVNTVPISPVLYGMALFLFLCTCIFEMDDTR